MESFLLGTPCVNYYSREDSLESAGLTYGASEMGLNMFDLRIDQGKTVHEFQTDSVLNQLYISIGPKGDLDLFSALYPYWLEFFFVS